MLNVNLALFKCHWGDEIGIIASGGKYRLSWEGKLPTIEYNTETNELRVCGDTFLIHYDNPDNVLSQIERGRIEVQQLLSELNRLINLPLTEKYAIIGNKLNVILGEGAERD